MKCEINKSNFKNDKILFIIIMYKNIPNYIAFSYLYNMIKLIKNTNKENKKLEIIIIIFLRLLLRWLFFIIFSYSIFITKQALTIFDIINKCRKQNFDSYKTFIQIILFDISLHYYSYTHSLVNKKKIKLNMKPTKQVLNKAKKL